MVLFALPVVEAQWHFSLTFTVKPCERELVEPQEVKFTEIWGFPDEWIPLENLSLTFPH